jgi:hypothetical protein
MDGDIHKSTQVQFVDKFVHIENFSKFENVSGNAASAAACMMSVIMMDEAS